MFIGRLSANNVNSETAKTTGDVFGRAVEGKKDGDHNTKDCLNQTAFNMAYSELSMNHLSPLR